MSTEPIESVLERVARLDRETPSGPWGAVAARTGSRIGTSVTEWFVRPEDDRTSIALASDVVNPATGKPSEPIARLIASYRTDAVTLAAEVVRIRHVAEDAQKLLADIRNADALAQWACESEPGEESFLNQLRAMLARLESVTQYAARNRPPKTGTSHG